MTTVCIVTESFDYEGEIPIATFDDSDEAADFAAKKASTQTIGPDEYTVYVMERNSEEVKYVWSYRVEKSWLK